MWGSNTSHIFYSLSISIENKTNIMTKDKTLDNDYEGMDSSIFYSSIIKEKSKLTSSDLSVEDTFSDETDTSELYDFIQKHESRYQPYVDELKSGIVRIKSSEVANKLFDDLYKEFSHKIDAVEIFSVILEYFGFTGSDYFEKLVLETRMLLIKHLSKRIDMGDGFIEQ